MSRTPLKRALDAFFDDVADTGGEGGEPQAETVRRLFDALLEIPEHITQIACRTMAWSLLSPGVAPEDLDITRQMVAGLVGGAVSPTAPTRPGPMIETPAVWTRATVAHGVRLARGPARLEDFNGMLSSFRRSHMGHLQGLPVGDRWIGWMDDVVGSAHGTPPAQAVAWLGELAQSEPVGNGSAYYDGALREDPAHFGEVWLQTVKRRSLERVLDATHVERTGRTLIAHCHVTPNLATPLAVEYLFEEQLLWRMHSHEFQGFIDDVEYHVGPRSWSHHVV